MTDIFVLNCKRNRLSFPWTGNSYISVHVETTRHGMFPQIRTQQQLIIPYGIKKGHIGIVEKAQETSSDSDMHNTVLVPLLYFMNSGCVLECRETPTSWVTI